MCLSYLGLASLRPITYPTVKNEIAKIANILSFNPKNNNEIIILMVPKIIPIIVGKIIFHNIKAPEMLFLK